MSSELLHFRLELERDGDAITGRLTAEHGEAISFTGWLELINALEEARSASEPTSDDEAARAPERRA